MTEPLLSIVGGGLVAAVVTIVFNVYWDKKKDRAAQDWEFKRYRANLIHTAAFGLMDSFFAAKTELEYLVGTLATHETMPIQLGMQADTIGWNQYEQKVKDVEAKAHSYLSVLRPLIPATLHGEIVTLFAELSADYEWNLPEALTRLQLFNDKLPQFQAAHEKLSHEIEVKLGRKP